MSGPQCCANPPTLNPSSGAGHVEKVGGLDSYVSGSPDSKLVILLVSDILWTLCGYEAPNLRKLADKIAAAGFYAVVPDFFYGDPFVPGNAEKPLQVWIKDHGMVSSWRSLCYIDSVLWIVEHQISRPSVNSTLQVDKGYEDAKPVIEALNSKGVTAIGAVGFCWGAKVVVELGKSSAFIKAAVLCHPSFVTVDDIKELKVPISILGAEIDQLSPPALLKQFEDVLASKSEAAVRYVDSFVKVFPKVAHGWTVRYNVEDEAAVKSAEEAHGNLLEWFVKYVKRAWILELLKKQHYQRSVQYKEEMTDVRIFAMLIKTCITYARAVMITTVRNAKSNSYCCAVRKMGSSK
ncbi:hypothetical protein DKX38_018563 [Salix brachista]|uniref:Dienelactone hydrolase domain-containing protein n=1 Tax=Salix brachista TaxID=2182728 RepID=A0A5N5KND9_9ROSI|nr:hypothetical protein DKX38_018563 [Salix brachista]